MWATPSVIVHWVDKKVWRSGRGADCNPVRARMLLLKHSCSVKLVRHSEKCRKSSIFIVKFSSGMSETSFFLTPVWIGPASPDAGVELLRQLFLQWTEETASHLICSRFSCLVEDSCESMQGHLHAHGYSMCEFSKKKCAAMAGCYSMDHGHNTVHYMNMWGSKMGRLWV